MRYKNIDIIRSVALSIVIIYHIWVLSGSRDIPIPILFDFVKLGGELGVTLFFIISGFGIYCSLYKNEDISYKTFIKKRFIRIAPEYYISLLFTLLMIGGGACYLSKMGLVDIITHLLFIHNLFPNHAGTINGVLWTMGNIVQFYVVAIPLYRCLKKYPFITLVLSVFVTIGTKFIVLGRILPHFGLQYQFWASRNFFFSTFDNFVIGMYVAYLLSDRPKLKIPRIVSALLIFFVLMILYMVCKLGEDYGIHTPNWSGYIWHTLIAIILGVVIILASQLSTKMNIINRFLMWVSKNEYSIYIMHLIMIQTLLSSAPFFQWLNSKGSGLYVLLVTILYLLAIIVGYTYSVMMSPIRERLSFLKEKKDGKKSS